MRSYVNKTSGIGLSAVKASQQEAGGQRGDWQVQAAPPPQLQRQGWVLKGLSSVLDGTMLKPAL